MEGELEKIIGYAVEAVMLGASLYAAFRLFSYNPGKKKNQEYQSSKPDYGKKEKND